MGKILRDRKISFPKFKEAFGKYLTQNGEGRILTGEALEKHLIKIWEDETGRKYKEPKKVSTPVKSEE